MVVSQGGTLWSGDGVSGTLRGTGPCDVSLTGVYGVVVSRGGDTWCTGTYLSAHTVRRTDGRPTTEGLVVSASGHRPDVRLRPGSSRGVAPVGCPFPVCVVVYLG
jgi:hypothetical protein